MSFFKTAFLFSIFNFAYSQNIISIEAFDEQPNNTSQITLRARISNNTKDTLT